MISVAEKMPVTFAGVDRPGTVPKWASGYDVTRSTVADLCETAKLPAISVVRSSGPQKIFDAIDLISKLFECLLHAPDLTTRLVLGFKKAERQEFLNLASILAKYPGLSGRIEFARQADDLEDAILEAMTKVIATRSERDPLGEVQTIVKAGRALRTANGRLDAKKVASTFDIPLTELARQIGVTKQRISKTSDSEALQPLLRPYERIARLRTVLSDADFKVWLNTPNEHLEDGDSPIDYLKAGAQKPLASFAENMLTGAPA